MRTPVCTILFCVLIPLLATAQQDPAGGRRVWVDKMVGDIKVRRSGSVEWVDARMRMPLKESDAVRAFMESEAEIKTSEGTIIKVSENTTFELASLRQGPGGEQDTRVKVLNGSIVSDVKKLMTKSSKFEFETPTAVASIRGTRVGLDVSGEQTDIRVYEGTVYVVPNGAKNGADVGANQMTTIVKGQQDVKITVLRDRVATVAPVVDSSKPPVPDTAATEKPLVNDTADQSRSEPELPDTAQSQPQRAASADTVETEPERTLRGDTVAAPVAQLTLTLIEPVAGAEIAVAMPITVRGAVKPAGATVKVRGQTVRVGSDGQFRISLPAPTAAGEIEIAVDAQFQEQSRSESRRINVIALKSECLFQLSSPQNGQLIAKPQIDVAGMVSPGSEVEAGGMVVPVGADGRFSAKIPIPAEEGEFELQVQSTCGGKTSTVSRVVRYLSPLQLTVTAPASGQIVTSPMVPVKGVVKPATAELTVNGLPLPVQSGGAFAGVARLEDEEGEHALDFDVASEGGTTSETRMVVYRRPNTDVPMVQGSFPPYSKSRTLYFTVIDRTINDEITFHRQIDGTRDTELGVPQGRFSLDLLDGVHDYAVWAVDKAGNTSPRLSGRVGYMSTSGWMIRMRRPAASRDRVLIPPAGPGGGFEPAYTVEFSVENLPNDNYELLQEVAVVNTTSGDSKRITTMTDIDFEIELALKRNADNTVTISARDRNGVLKTQTVIITVK